MYRSHASGAVFQTFQLHASLKPRGLRKMSEVVPLTSVRRLVPTGLGRPYLCLSVDAVFHNPRPAATNSHSILFGVLAGACGCALSHLGIAFLGSMYSSRTM